MYMNTKDDFLRLIKSKVQCSCPLCGSGKDWFTTSEIMSLSSYKQGAVATCIPVVPLSCPNCGYTILLNADILGLI